MNRAPALARNNTASPMRECAFEIPHSYEQAARRLAQPAIPFPMAWRQLRKDD